MCSWFAGTTTAFFFSSGDWVECTLTLANNGYFLHISLGFIVCHIAWFEIKTALRVITQTNVELSISACAPWYPASNPTLRYTCICPPHTHSFWGEETKQGWKGRKRKEGKRIKRGIIIKKTEHKRTELSADRTEEDKNLWFLWFHQHD